MPRLSDLYLAEADLTLEVGDKQIQVRYRPGVYTEAYEARLMAASQASASPTGIDDLNQLLCDVLVRADLTDDEDQPIPLTRAALAEKLPLPVSVAVSGALMKALRGGEALSAARK